EAGEEGRTAHLAQRRARSDDEAVRATPAPGPDALRPNLERRLGHRVGPSRTSKTPCPTLVLVKQLFWGAFSESDTSDAESVSLMEVRKLNVTNVTSVTIVHLVSVRL